MMRHVEIYLNTTLFHAFIKYEEGDSMRCAWRGHLDLPPDDMQANAIIWAFFQNPKGVMVESTQDEAWIEKTQDLTKGYEDRSLSAGDVVTLDEHDSYAIELSGWTRLDVALIGAPIVGPEGDQTLREQAEAVNAKQVAEAEAKGECPACGGPLEMLSPTAVRCQNTRLCGFRHVGDDVAGFMLGGNDDA